MRKNAFVLYLEYEEILEDLTDAEIGQLFRAILRYERTQEMPVLPMQIMIPFKFVKKDLDNNRKKWEQKCEKNRKNGSLGGRPKNQTVIPKTEPNPDEPKKPDRENDHSCDHSCGSESEGVSPPNTLPLSLSVGICKDEVFAFAKEQPAPQGIDPLFVAKKFFATMSANGWRDSNSKCVTERNWRGKFLGWLQNEKPLGGNARPNKKPKKSYDYCDAEKARVLGCLDIEKFEGGAT